MANPTVSYDLRPCALSVVRDLCAQYHGYGGAGGVATYSFAVYENDKAVAAFAWQPPAPGSAQSVCPSEPSAVIALSRMVAVPREERELNHISKPLRRQMDRLIDRTRYPVLVTYSDEGQGHTGHVYKCSGWTATTREKRRWYYSLDGSRISSYCNGKTRAMGGSLEGIRGFSAGRSAPARLSKCLNGCATTDGCVYRSPARDGAVETKLIHGSSKTTCASRPSGERTA
jgi:hypothetical protein